jgi:uncharacterized repeat protein (TIGR03803 family)
LQICGLFCCNCGNSVFGANPQAALILGTDDNFYGTTYDGGTHNEGTVFSINSLGAENVIYNFNILPQSPNLFPGSNPKASLIRGSDGNFYGTTYTGGVDNQSGGDSGTIFKVTESGLETILYNFLGNGNGSNDGANPAANLILESGNFYGTTFAGGNNNNGTVFTITPSGNETILYRFSGGHDGSGPEAALTLGNDGSFYGTTYSGGMYSHGTIFKLTLPGIESVVYSFGSNSGDGANPEASLLLSSDGNFYGTTYSGGSNNYGTVFKLTPSGTETILHSFSSGNDGANPQAALILGTDGNFYGTTTMGGTYNQGTVFKITPSGTETIIYNFGNLDDGANPVASLSLGNDGNFYGTTYNGGIFGYGTLFSLTSTGNETILYNFLNGSDGANPAAGLLLDNGFFYGTTYSGANINGSQGTIFKLSF